MSAFACFPRLAAAVAMCVLALPLPAAAAPRHPVVVTVLGDSIAAGYGLPSHDALPLQLQAALERLKAPAVVRNAGLSGDTTAGGLSRVDRAVRPDTDVCVVELGANDLLQGVEPRRTEANLNAIVGRLKARGIAVVVAGGKVPFGLDGEYVRAFDAVFASVARRNGVLLAPDLLEGVVGNPNLKQPDGLHPNAAGVKVLAARLAPVVIAAIRQTDRPGKLALR